MGFKIGPELANRLDFAAAVAAEVERPPDRLPSRVAEQAAATFLSAYADRVQSAYEAGFDVALQEIVWMPKARFRYRPLTALPLRERVVLRALVADLTTAGKQGTAFGLYNAALGVGALAASVTFGFLYDRFGAGVAFGTGSALAACAALLLASIRTAPKRDAMIVGSDA